MTFSPISLARRHSLVCLVVCINILWRFFKFQGDKFQQENWYFCRHTFSQSSGHLGSTIRFFITQATARIPSSPWFRASPTRVVANTLKPVGVKGAIEFLVPC